MIISDINLCILNEDVLSCTPILDDRIGYLDANIITSPFNKKNNKFTMSNDIKNKITLLDNNIFVTMNKLIKLIPIIKHYDCKINEFNICLIDNNINECLKIMNSDEKYQNYILLLLQKQQYLDDYLDDLNKILCAIPKNNINNKYLFSNKVFNENLCNCTNIEIINSLELCLNPNNEVLELKNPIDILTRENHILRESQSHYLPRLFQIVNIQLVVMLLF